VPPLAIALAALGGLITLLILGTLVTWLIDLDTGKFRHPWKSPR
jgi:hypothetical protein